MFRMHSQWKVALAACGVIATLASSAVAADKNPATEKTTPEASGKMKMEKAAPAAEAPKADASHDAQMAEMMKAAAPGPNHEWLKKSEGSWKATIKMWAAPGEPAVSEGTSENHMILGGRYLEQRFKGTFMGQPFEGYGLTGYDNLSKTFRSVWVDNSSTGMMTGTGSADETGKTLTMASTMTGPDGKPAQSRTVTKIVDDKTVVWSLYDNAAGKEVMVMEITYTKI